VRILGDLLLKLSILGSPNRKDLMLLITLLFITTIKKMMKPYKKYKIIKNKIEKFQKIIYE
jgi:hypothetical protein